jgi:hypothetical protein
VDARSADADRALCLAGPVGSALEGRIRFAAPGISQAADQVCDLVKDGIVNSVSIGFEPLTTTPDRDGLRRVTSCELQEISFVTVPADTAALVTERSFTGRLDAPMRRRLGLCGTLRMADSPLHLPPPTVYCRGDSVFPWTRDMHDHLVARCLAAAAVPSRRQD